MLNHDAYVATDVNDTFLHCAIDTLSSCCTGMPVELISSSHVVAFTRMEFTLVRGTTLITLLDAIVWSLSFFTQVTLSFVSLVLQCDSFVEIQHGGGNFIPLIFEAPSVDRDSVHIPASFSSVKPSNL